MIFVLDAPDFAQLFSGPVQPLQLACAGQIGFVNQNAAGGCRRGNVTVETDGCIGGHGKDVARNLERLSVERLRHQRAPAQKQEIPVFFPGSGRSEYGAGHIRKKPAGNGIVE